ncbi:MAG: hypothetical protein PVG25_10300 [Anaerolineae bacterium]
MSSPVGDAQQTSDDGQVGALLALAQADSAVPGTAYASILLTKLEPDG